MKKQTFYVVQYTDMPEELADEMASSYCAGNDTLVRIYHDEPDTPLSIWLTNQEVPLEADVLLEFCW